MHLGGGPAEPVRLDGEVAGGRVALEPADLVQGQLPAVLGVRQVALEQAEGGRLGALQPALEPGGDAWDAGRAGPREGEREFEVGVGAGADPPEQLEDQRRPVDDRAVALLGGAGPARQVGGQAGPRRAAEGQRAEPVAGRQVLQQPAGELRVVHGVVQHGAVVRALGEPPEDGARADAGRLLRAGAQQQLVDVPVRGAGGAGVLDPQQQVQQRGVADLERGADDRREAGDRVALAGVPALGGEPVGDQRQRCLDQLADSQGGPADPGAARSGRHGGAGGGVAVHRGLRPGGFGHDSLSPEAGRLPDGSGRARKSSGFRRRGGDGTRAALGCHAIVWWAVGLFSVRDGAESPGVQGKSNSRTPRRAWALRAGWPRGGPVGPRNT